jgi:alcohol dehydrogenase class IV
LFAGLAFSNTKTAIAHSLSYPITLRHGVAHGIACSFTLPLVVESVAGVGGLCEASLERIYETGTEQAAARLADFLSQLGVPTNPSAHGVQPGEWSEIVATAFDGERGKNFIGDKERFMQAAEALRAAAAE